MYRSHASSGSPGGIVLDSTLTRTIASSDESHVTIFTPAGSPRVLHEPVVLASGRVSAISNNEGGVIKRGSTVTVKDSALVSLESETSSVNTNRERLDSSSFHHGCHVVRNRSSLSSGDARGGLGLRVSASTS